jgi:hypothetical protein
MTSLKPKVLAPSEGLRLQSGPGRDLIFKVTGEDTGGAFDYFIVEVAPKAGRRSTSTTTSRRRSTLSRADTGSRSATRRSTSRKVASPTSRHASRMRSST